MSTRPEPAGPAQATLRRTPLHVEHVAAGAKIIPFAGWEMPVHYPAGISAEHHAVRRAAGVFDVSHMGELELHGARALELIQHLTPNDAARLEVGQAQYSALLREDGTMIDDLLVYRFPTHWMLVVNASNRERARDWVERYAVGFEVEVRDRTEEIALIALQGRSGEPILRQLTRHPLERIHYYRFEEAEVAGAAAVISRTGYTGEDGFELYVAAEAAATLWRRLLDAGADHGLLPAGLGARDSLRLEMGYALYGNDLSDERTPLEAGLGWIVKLEKGEFLGRAALQRQKDQGVREKLTGFRLVERGFPRPGYPLCRAAEPVGVVTSGILSPSLGEGIGLGYVPAELARPGTDLEVMIRDRAVRAETTRPPFYKEGTVKSG